MPLMFPPHANRTEGIQTPQLLAQKLNNRAAFLIKSHSYGKSIAVLVRALKLAQRYHSDSVSEEQNGFELYSLESSLGMAEDEYSSLMNKEKEDLDDDVRQKSDCEQSPFRYEQCERGCCAGYIYQRPILIPGNYIVDCRYIGLPLPLIIMFNLALAHQLRAISMTAFHCENDGSSLSFDRNTELEKALHLYQLAYQLHLNYLQQQPNSIVETSLKDDSRRSMGSFRFTMVLSNNIGEIHRFVGDSAKHKMCLEHLLSTVMCAVNREEIDLDSSVMDGYYHNLSSIMNTNNCADAA